MVLEQLKAAVVAGQKGEVEAQVQTALEEGYVPTKLLDESLIPAMMVVGDKFKNGDIFVPEMLIAARAMQAGVKILEPLLLAGERKYVGKAVIGTVRGDLHDIGKNLVIMMLKGAGWDVIDLGIDVSPEKFVAAVKEHQPQMLGLSALLTTTMPAMKSTIEALTEAGLRDSVKVIIGGAPVSQKFAGEIGADAYAADAGDAIDKLAALL